MAGKPMNSNGSTSAISASTDKNQPFPIRFLESKVFHGCNVYHVATVIRQRVDMGDLKDITSAAAGSEFVAQYIERFVELKLINPTGLMGADFLLRLREDSGAPLVEFLLEAIISVESAIRFTMRNFAPINFAEVFPVQSPGCYDLVWECSTPRISRAAVQTGRLGVLELLPIHYQAEHPATQGQKFSASLAKLNKLARRRQLSSRSAVIGLAAKRLGVPCEHIGGAYLNFGQGVAQKIVHESFVETIRDSAPSPNSHSAKLEIMGANKAPPQLQQKSAPTLEEARESLKLMFPNSANGHIPAIVVVGDQGTTRVARSLESLMLAADKAVGLSVAKRSRICGVALEHETSRQRSAAHFLLQDPRAEIVICAKTSRSVAAQGLGIDRCDVAAILDPRMDGDSEAYRHSLKVMLAATKRAFVVSVTNHSALDVIKPTNAQQVLLVSANPNDERLQRHRDAGGAAVVNVRYDDGEYIEVVRGKSKILSIRTTVVLNGAKKSLSLQEQMFVLGLAYATGLTGKELESATSLLTPLNSLSA